MVIEIDALSAQLTSEGLSASSSVMDFGSIPQKVIVKSRLIITNITNAPQPLTIDLSQLSPVTATSNCPASLLSKRACVIDLKLDSTSLSISSVINESFTVNAVEFLVSASIASPVPLAKSVMIVDAASLAMGNVDQGSSVKKIVRLMNPSSYTQDLDLNTSGLDNFEIVKSNCGTQLATKRICEITLKLDTINFGTVSETIEFQGNDYTVSATVAAPGGSSIISQSDSSAGDLGFMEYQWHSLSQEFTPESAFTVTAIEVSMKKSSNDTSGAKLGMRLKDLSNNIIAVSSTLIGMTDLTNGVFTTQSFEFNQAVASGVKIKFEVFIHTIGGISPENQILMTGSLTNTYAGGQPIFWTDPNVLMWNDFVFNIKGL